MIQALGVGSRIGGGGVGWWRGSGGLNVCDDEGQQLSELTHGQDKLEDSGGEGGRLQNDWRLPPEPCHEHNPGDSPWA